MRILWLRPSKGDNISVRRERIAEKLRERGYDIDICDATGFDAVSAIKKAVTNDYDVIAGNVRVGLYIGYPLSQILRKPFLGDVSDPISDINYLPEPLFRFFEWYEWKVLQRADATVFVYESTHQKALKRNINDAVKLPNAVNYDAFADPDEEVIEKAKKILTENTVDPEKPIAIYIGVLSPSYLIRNILDTAEVTPDWEFVFLGEGPLESEVQQRTTDIENAHFPGAFPYQLMPGFLDQADVGFCFKDAEQPLKLKEYGAAGIPAIVRPGELERWYNDEELAFVEPDPNSISAELNKLSSNSEMRDTYGRNLQTIAKKYSWERVADGYHQLFKKIRK
ncbi:Glycosyltransferase involved in cell wall bisynthesis [Natronorubrum sediminis]|uniref:Glycosyltransferase involved in cell wall bisynthesis n=1 Tax=Natronorubrum sediminis TaxID=640943 RepID=A0A1H6FYM7_9EURY|nr:glycosyltransferase family 4 protein [Natronorubrum sediminis]SEH15896.1 Glycosyltransferase involved in cell wall bisynthesis [Natronorubrum sediminis]